VVEDVFHEFKHRFNYFFLDNDASFKASKEFVSYFICNLYCRIYVPNQIIMRKGDRFAEMYLIEGGHVMMSLKTKW
jgi:hypothetical protein